MYCEWMSKVSLDIPEGYEYDETKENIFVKLKDKFALWLLKL